MSNVNRQAIEGALLTVAALFGMGRLVANGVVDDLSQFIDRVTELIKKLQAKMKELKAPPGGNNSELDGN